MNLTLRVIRNRRSIRAFKHEQIKPEELEAIVEAGVYAPSASNKQNVHFTVIQKKELVEKVNGWIVEEIQQGGNEYLKKIVERSGGSIFRNAPTVIIVSSEEKDRFSNVNAAAATENMLIAAESLEIGSCWIGMVSVLSISKSLGEFKKVLLLPEGYVPQNGITLGYKASENPEAPERKKDLVSYIK